MVGNKARSCRTLQAMQRTCDFMLSQWEALKSFNQRTNIVKPLLLKDCFGVRWRVEIKSNKSKRLGKPDRRFSQRLWERKEGGPSKGSAVDCCKMTPNKSHLLVLSPPTLDSGLTL